MPALTHRHPPTANEIDEANDSSDEPRPPTDDHEDASHPSGEGEAALAGEPTSAGSPDEGRIARWFGPLTPWKLASLILAVLFFGAAAGYTIRDAESQASSAVDVGFLRDMTVHHQQALVIAKTALYGDLPDGVRSFADEVVTQQSMEIGLMQATLYRLNEEPEGNGTAMDWMGMPVPVDDMPGLASPEELSRLEALDGEEAAELFFALMTRHHLGGLHMAEAAAQDAEDPWIRDLASQMARGQQAEVVEYRAARTRLGLGLPEGYDETPRLEIPAAERDDDQMPSPSFVVLGVITVTAAAGLFALLRRRRSTTSGHEPLPDESSPPAEEARNG